jgi:alpha/beta superfamily hydrolase
VTYRCTVVETVVASGGLRLRAYLASPPPSAGGPGIRRHGLVVCHGFPPGPKGAATAGQSYPQLADRLANEAGWAVLTFQFRGAGESEGDFSLAGWLADVRAAIDHLRTATAVDGIWLAGFGAGGSLALCAAGEDELVRGVASFASQADFEAWGADPRRFLETAREVGVVRTKGYPEDFDSWARELREIRPLSLIGKIPPRPVLIVHGSEDDVVPLVDARALADAAAGEVELRVITGAGHRLRHDPRAIAVLFGWLERQHL